VKSFAPLLAQGPLFICFFLAIKRMAAGLPSFTSGGTAWFTDLSAVDPTYLSPLVSALTFLATVELGAVDGMQGNPAARNVKLGMRALAVAMVPLTAGFPQGVFVYWVTSNCFSFVQAAAFKWQRLRHWCRIPEGQASQMEHPLVLLANRPVTKTLQGSEQSKPSSRHKDI
jgi:YidC/Oxa1 family membrane protein insertase